MAESASATFTPPPPSPWPRRFAVAVVVALLIGGLWWGWQSWTSGWMPDRARWPTQGVAVGHANEPIDWPALAKAGASFAYVDARGVGRINPDFEAEVDAAKAAGLRVGVAYNRSLCPSWDQSSEFVTLIARDPTMLPPLIILDRQEWCDRWPTRAAVISELTTFLTQVETHLGKSAIIAPDDDFEEFYSIKSAINRPVMIMRNRSEPTPDDGEWTIWQANDAALVAGSTGPTRWLVANDGTGMVQTGADQ